MTSVRDFSEEGGHSRERAQTWATRSHHPRSPTMHTRSPPAHDNRELDRRGSVASKLSNTSVDEHHLRHRGLSRSNTVRTYHEHEQNQWQQPGAEPGIDTNAEDEKVPPHLVSIKAPCGITIIDFSDSTMSQREADNETIAQVLEEPRSEGSVCRWISVNGLSWDVIRSIGKKYPLHRLAVEDLIHTHSRTKVDWYKDQAFVVLTLQKLVRLHHDGDSHDCPSNGDVESHGSGSDKSWWPAWRSDDKDTLPRYLDRDGDGRIDEFIKAHSSTSEQSPIKDIRTLHRYESAQIPEHTAFMEKHSALMVRELFAFFLVNGNSC